MSNLSINLKALMRNVGKTGITVTELARQTGVGQPVIHRMASGETDNPKVGSLIEISKFLNVNISQLIGIEPLPKDRFAGTHNPFYRAWAKLPLLSWEQAAVWPEKRIPAEIESYISTESIVSDNAFAIRMEDSTMLPRYAEGAILIVEPNIKPRNNDFAAVVVEGDTRMQFKQVLYDGSDLYLKPLNQDFQVRNVGSNYRILGALVQAISEFYQERVIKEEVESIAHKPPVKKRKDETAEATE